MASPSILKFSDLLCSYSSGLEGLSLLLLLRVESLSIGILPLHDAGVLEALPPEGGNSVKKMQYLIQGKFVSKTSCWEGLLANSLADDVARSGEWVLSQVAPLLLVVVGILVAIAL